MDIFSKRDGPRQEDVRAKRLISENSGTIRRLADQISNGGFTKMRQDQKRRAEEPKPDGLMIYTMSAPARPDDPEPYVRVSLNGRVVLADRNSGRQLQLLGEIRGGTASRRLVLATKDNGFISPVGDDLVELLGSYDGSDINAGFTEDDLVLRFEQHLGLADTDDPGDSEPVSESGDGAPDDDSTELL